MSTADRQAENIYRVKHLSSGSIDEADRTGTVPLSAEAFDAAVIGNGQDNPVLPGRFGQHLITPTKQNGSWFERALHIAELPPMTIHDLRHSAATPATKPSAVPCRVTWEPLPVTRIPHRDMTLEGSGLTSRHREHQRYPLAIRGQSKSGRRLYEWGQRLPGLAARPPSQAVEVRVWSTTCCPRRILGRPQPD